MPSFYRLLVKFRASLPPADFNIMDRTACSDNLRWSSSPLFAISGILLAMTAQVILA